MLEGLAGIDWDRLEDAYGPATGVPEFIRGLASRDRGTREEALEELHNQVCHQGSVSEASAHVVPFLIELLREPSVGGKEGILDLLAGLAQAQSDQEGLLGERGPVAESLRADPDFEQKLENERGWVKATRGAVAAGVPLYLQILEKSDGTLRYRAANLLAALRAEPPRVAAALRAAITRETADGVRCGLLLLLGELGGEHEVAFLRDVLSQASGSALIVPGSTSRANPPLRWGAAVALVRILRDKAPPEAMRVLTDTLELPDVGGDWDGLPESEGPSVRAAGFTLALLEPRSAVQHLARALDRADPASQWDLLDLLLGLAFPVDEEPARPLSGRSLTGPQRAALAAIAASDSLWRQARLVESSLECLGLPTSRNALRAFVAG